MNADTWTEQDEHARRLDAIEAHIRTWKQTEQRRARRQGLLIAVAVGSSMWSLVIVGVLRVIL